MLIAKQSNGKNMAVLAGEKAIFRKAAARCCKNGFFSLKCTANYCKKAEFHKKSPRTFKSTGICVISEILVYRFVCLR